MIVARVVWTHSACFEQPGPLTGSCLTDVEHADDVETSFQQAMAIHLLDRTLERSGATKIMPNGGLMPHHFSRVHGLSVKVFCASGCLLFGTVYRRTPPPPPTPPTHTHTHVQPHLITGVKRDRHAGYHVPIFS